MITLILGAVAALLATLLATLWLALLLQAIRVQRRTIKLSGDHIRKIHRLALDAAEIDPFARIYLDEHRKYVDQLHDLGDSKAGKR